MNRFNEPVNQLVAKGLSQWSEAQTYISIIVIVAACCSYLSRR